MLLRTSRGAEYEISAFNPNERNGSATVFFSNPPRLAKAVSDMDGCEYFTITDRETTTRYDGLSYVLRASEQGQALFMTLCEERGDES